MMTRRSFTGLSAWLSLARSAGLCRATECATDDRWQAIGHDGIWLNANENPDGPCKEAVVAVRQVLPECGRYLTERRSALAHSLSRYTGIPAASIGVFIGSSDALAGALIAFTTPRRGIAMGDPSYEPVAAFGEYALGVPVRRVPLRDENLRHDATRLVENSQDLGVVYICNPNNPTGTITPLLEISYVLNHKAPHTVVIVDEAYAEYTDALQSALELVLKGEDVIVLRTFSKLYGLAGLRCGVAYGRSDLLRRIEAFCGNPLPVTAIAAAQASLAVPGLVTLRRDKNRRTRDRLFEFFEKHGFRYVPSETNFFVLDTEQDGINVVREMRKHNIAIAPPPRAWPRHIRVTVGSPRNMERFRNALALIMS